MKKDPFLKSRIRNSILLLFFLGLGIFSAVLIQKKIKNFDVLRLRVDLITASERQPKQTAVDGLRNRAFENLIQRIRRRDLSVESLDVSGILFIEREGEFFFFLNANSSARLTLDGQEITRSSVF